MRTPDPNALYRTLVEHMNEVVWMCDEEEKTMYANPKFCEVMGYSLEEVVGRQSYDFWDDESAARVRRVNETDRKQGISSSYEGTLLTKGGRRISVLVSGTPLPGGGTMGIMTDLTELKKRESLYRTLVEHMKEALWVCDEEERTVYVNPTFCEMMGYSLTEMLGRQSYDYWDEETAKHVRHVIETDRRQGISSSYEGILVTKSGRRIPVFVNGTPLPDGGSMGIITDLTELKRKESMYRMLVENMNEAVCMSDSADRTVYVNPKFCQMMGYEPHEVMGKHVDEFLDEKSATRVRQIVQQQRRRGISSSYECILVTKVGGCLPVLVSGTPLPDGGTIGIITDLTELKEKREQKKILGSAIQHANDAIVVMDRTGRVESWNKGAKILFGYKPQEMIGTSIQAVFSSEDMEVMLQQSEARYNFEFSGKHKNGQVVIVSATLTPILGEGTSTPSSWLLIARDITSQRAFEEELSLKYQKIRDAYNQFGIVRRQMDYVFELTDLCRGRITLKSIADFIVNAVIMLTRVDACLLRIYEPEKDTLRMVSSFGLSEDWKGKAIVKYKDSMTKRAVESGGPLKIIDIAKHTTYHSRHLAKKSNLTSMVVYPLIFQSELVGSLSLYAGPEKKLEIFENDFIEKYASLLALAIARCRVS